MGTKKNSKVLCRDWCDEEARLRFWGKCMRGALYAAAALRPQLETCTKLETVNNAIVRRIQNVLRQPWENITLHRKHVNAELSVARSSLGLDVGLEFCKCLVRWLGHVWRHPHCHLYKLLQHQNDLWLRNQRMSGDGNRPGTRQETGPVFRWAQTWVHLIEEEFETSSSSDQPPSSGWVFEKADKNSILVRASFLQQWIRPAATVSRAIMDQASALVPAN